MIQPLHERLTRCQSKAMACWPTLTPSVRCVTSSPTFTELALPASGVKSYTSLHRLSQIDRPALSNCSLRLRNKAPQRRVQWTAGGHGETDEASRT